MPLTNEKILKNIQEARSIAEKAVAESRNMTEEERNKAFNLYQEAKTGFDDTGLQAKLTELEIAAAKGEQPEKPEQKKSGDFGRQFVDSAEYKSWMEKNAPNGRIPDSFKGFTSPAFGVNLPLERKALVTGGSNTSGGAFIESDHDGYMPMSAKPLVLRDLVSVQQTDSDLIEYIVQTARIIQAVPVAEATSAAGPTVETTATGDPLVYTSTVTPNAGGGYKPEGTITFTKKTTAVTTIPVFLPVTKQALSDAPQLRSIINQDLLNALDEKLESQMLNGSGASPEFTGVANTASILTQGFSTNIITTARKAITNLQTNGYEKPTGFVLHPTDWETVELALFAAAPYLPNSKTLWRVPVIESYDLSAGTGYLANWKRATLWDRQEATISMTDSHADFFIRNLVAILAELRAAFAVKKPAAFVKITTTNGG